MRKFSPIVILALVVLALPVFSFLIDTDAAKDSDVSIVKWARKIISLPSYRTVDIEGTSYRWQHYQGTDALYLKRTQGGDPTGYVASHNNTGWVGNAYHAPPGKRFHSGFPTLLEATQHVEALVAKHPKPFLNAKAKDDAARFIDGN